MIILPEKESAYKNQILLIIDEDSLSNFLREMWKDPRFARGEGIFNEIPVRATYDGIVAAWQEYNCSKPVPTVRARTAG